MRPACKETERGRTKWACARIMRVRFESGSEGDAGSLPGPAGAEFNRGRARRYYGMICLLRTARVVTGNSPGSQHWQICTSAAALISM